MNGLYLISMLLVLLAATSTAYPQDAEFISEDIPRRSDTPDGDGGILIVRMNPRPRTQFSLFDTLFRRPTFPFFIPRRRPEGSDGFPDVTVDSDSPINPSFPEFPFFPGGFGGSFPRFPSIPRIPESPDVVPSEVPDLGTLPDNYDNSTYDVKVVNGTKIEVNSTITKSKDDNGVFVQQVHIVRYSPEKETQPEIPTATPEVTLNPTGTAQVTLNPTGTAQVTLNPTATSEVTLNPTEKGTIANTGTDSTDNKIPTIAGVTTSNYEDFGLAV